MATQTPDEVPFQSHVDLLRFFLTHRDEIVEGIQGALNAQRKPLRYLQDLRALSRDFEDCFFTLASVTADQARLKGQLEHAHWSTGFKPREIPGMHNDLVNPAEMMRRAFRLWGHTRWPGRAGRVRYAHTLFDLYVIRHLALLGMRAWDAGASSASDRLALVQDVLDALWNGGVADQPVLVRDARWLIPVALSPATDELSPYFEAAERIAETPTEDDRIEIHDAIVRMAGGHLRSYLHYYITQKGASLDDGRLVLIIRKSNALDSSLLIRGLVPLLEAYERAVQRGDGEKRLKLAEAICQGVSPDPELFVNRVDLLGAYSMVEHLFTRTDGGGHVVYTPTGLRHVQLLRDYGARIGRVAKELSDDCKQFRPVDGAYSPYGVLYGISSNLFEHMALKTLQSDAAARFALEDVFSGGGAEKLDWVSGWRKLPHVDPHVRKLYDYPQSFAEKVYERVAAALKRRAHASDEQVAPTGRLYVAAADDRTTDSRLASIPELPLRYIASSDPQIVAAGKANACGETQLSSERLEGHFVLSYETPGGCVAITKDVLTEVLGAGCDARIAGLPRNAVERLSLTCRELVVPPQSGDASP
jgi:hypothetical protein